MQTISVNKSSLRRGALFLIGIAGPALAGVVLHESAAAVVAAVFGLLLSFSDQDGPLSGRYRILFLSAAGLIAGAVAGYLLRDYRIAFWIVFVLGAFAAGLANRYGRIPAMAARHACMALSVAFGVPVVQPMELMFCAGTLVLVVVARALDHLLFGHLPQLRQPARTDPPDPSLWLRFALAYTAAAAVGLWIGIALDPERAAWVSTTVLVVMQPDARVSYRRIVSRIFGAFVGVIGAYAVAHVFTTPVLLLSVVLVVALLIPHHLPHRYWAHTALIAMMILLLYDLADAGALGRAVFAERLQDMLLGCTMALIGTAVAFPRGKTKLP